jgi:pimeloyl-ACP methyl ester carboxylesterase
LRAGFEYYRATPTDLAHNNENIKTKLRMPVLALGGAQGKGRGTQVLENLRELATDVRGGAIERCGHWVPEEQPEELAKALLGFFPGK